MFRFSICLVIRLSFGPTWLHAQLDGSVVCGSHQSILQCPLANIRFWYIEIRKIRRHRSTIHHHHHSSNISNIWHLILEQYRMYSLTKILFLRSPSVLIFRLCFTVSCKDSYLFQPSVFAFLSVLVVCLKFHEYLASILKGGAGKNGSTTAVSCLK